MAISIGSWVGKLGLDTSDFSRGMIGAQGIVSVFGQTVATAITNPMLGAVDVLKQAATAAVRAAGDTLDYAETISRVASEANITTDTLQTLREVLEDAGRGAEGADAAVQRFNFRLGELKDGTGSAADEFLELKLDPAKFRDTDDAIRRTIEALAAMEDRSRAATLAGGLFEKQYGRSVVDAVRLAGGSIATLTQQYQRLGVVLSQTDLGVASQLDARVDEITNRIQGLQRQFGIGLVEGVNDGLQRAGGLSQLDGLGADVREAAKELGAAVGQLAPVIRDFVGGVAELTRGTGGFIAWASSRDAAVIGNNTDRYGNQTAMPLTTNVVDWLYGNPAAARELYGDSWRESLRRSRTGGAK